MKSYLRCETGVAERGCGVTFRPVPRLLCRAVAAPLVVAALAAGVLATTAAPALADDATTLTVVGTSDVYDSNLVQSVIKPGFEAAYPGVTLNYVSKGTGAAIAYAEQGSASAMIVHAASLENQFVGQGYSLEDYGRAIFWGDYVLLGPKSDPAKVKANAPRDIVAAFQRVAAAGVKGKATFVSRGGTPGTTVQEHALWALTTGVPTCTVSDVNGGGTAPSTTSGACPVVPTNPGWYKTTGLTQGPNIINADTCNYPSGGCYVFTDRGTYQYLQSTGQAQNLQIVTQNNKAAAPGGTTALVNSFHAYAVNPAKFADNPNVQLNPTAAQNFLNWITAPGSQAAIGAYLANSPQGAPFIPSAAPRITTAYSPKTVPAGKTLTVSGSVSNVVPGTPALTNVPVHLLFTPATGGGPIEVANAVTASDSGRYTMSYKPNASGTYTVTSDPVTKIEEPDLTPPFGDKLAAGTSSASPVVPVAASVSITSVKGGTGVITGKAAIAPAVTQKAGQLRLFVSTDGGTTFTQASSPVTLPVGGPRTVTFTYAVPTGTYVVQLHYVNDGVVTEGTSAPSAAVTVS